MKTTLRSFAPIMFLAIVSTAAACGDDSSTDGAGAGGTGGSGGSAGSGGSGGSGGGTDAGETKIASSMGDWDVYRDPYADGGASPIPATIGGTVEAFWSGTEMRVKLSVTGLPPNRPFGSHIHKLACTDQKAGGHYQDVAATDGGVTDPAVANAMNEVWLDFTTDAAGAGSAEAKVKWRPRAGEAKAVMIHDQLTGTGGIAGAKLACISMPF